VRPQSPPKSFEAQSSDGLSQGPNQGPNWVICASVR